MPTYVYETIPSRPDEKPVRFEVRQGMLDAPLQTHPDTGQPVRRIISGGLGYLAKGGGDAGGFDPSCACGMPTGG